MMNLLDKIKGGIFGVAVGDAVGVPYEFKSRVEMQKRPATDMVGHGTHNQKIGTWSDDSSLTFCLIEGLIPGYNLNVIGKKFVNWYYSNYWTPRGYVFDVGHTTRLAINNIAKGHPPEICGGMDEYSNGNGSLMRISPMAYFLKNEENIEERYQAVKDISSITHAHFRSVFSCFIYIEYALLLLNGKDKYKAYDELKLVIKDFIKDKKFNPKEIQLFNKILENNIRDNKYDNIRGSGYVLHSLEASIWCLLNSENYEEAVLKAVNFGEDTDTTAAITGGLAGLYYGFNDIPETWKFQIARYDDIENLINRFADSLKEH